MQTYLTPGRAATVRRIIGGALGHTYTRTPRAVPATQDLWARAAPVPAAVETGRPCRYVDRRALIEQHPDGRIVTIDPPATGTIFAETLTIPHDDPLAPDDLVSDVVDPVSGRVLLAGPVSVQAVVDRAEWGAVTARVAVLRGPVTERATP